MNKKWAQVVFVLVFLFDAGFLVSQPELTDINEAIFEAPQDFEELDIVLHIPKMRQQISMKDVPFYTKLFCSYVYEEKIKKWYEVVAGYLFVSNKKI